MQNARIGRHHTLVAVYLVWNRTSWEHSRLATSDVTGGQAAQRCHGCMFTGTARGPQNRACKHAGAEHGLLSGPVKYGDWLCWKVRQRLSGMNGGWDAGEVLGVNWWADWGL